MYNLTEEQQQFYEEIKKEKNGVPFSAAHTMINPGNDTEGKNHLIISELIAINLLEIVEYNGIKYLRAAESQDINQGPEYDTRSYGYDVIGPPHSPDGMKSLINEFANNTETLFLILGTTSYEMFEEFLLIRMQKGYETVFIYPAYKSVSSDKKNHYKMEKRKWEKFIRDLSSSYKDKIQFRIADEDYSYIKNSMFTKTHARLNVRVEDSNDSSRKGILLRCENNNTLYEMAKKSYEDLLYDSHIDIRTDFVRYCLEHVKRDIIEVVVIIVLLCLCFVFPDTNGIWWAVLTGFVSDIIIDYLKEMKWRKTNLFPK